MWPDVAPMIVMVTLILTAGGVAILRPISKRLAELIQIMSQERLGGSQQREVADLRQLLAAMDTRIAELEERQNFAESLLEQPGKQPGENSAYLERSLAVSRELPPT